MGSEASVANTVKLSEFGTSDSVEYAATSMQGWRETMEDAHICRTELDSHTSLFAVFDGHGGKEAAVFVSRHFCQELLQNPNFAAKRFSKALIETFLYMDLLMVKPEGLQELYKIQQDIPDSYAVDAESVEEMQDFAGTTACVALIYGDELYVANAGDSRCVLARGNKAFDMSVDHKADLPSEKERVIKAGGFVKDSRVNGILGVSRALGDFELKTNPSRSLDGQVITSLPDIKHTKLTGVDSFLVLACDGVWDVLSSQNCVDYVNSRLEEGKSLEEISEGVCEKCLAEGEYDPVGTDNMTIIIVRLR